jgi:hypothetical protein
MVASINVERAHKSLGGETLHINLADGKISGDFAGLKFTDKDTKQIVIYLPSLEVSGYGDTVEEANEMVRFSIQDFLDYLISLPSADIQKQLSKLGWRRGIFNTEYSRVNDDPKGYLSNYNIDDNSIENITLTAA